MFKRLEALGCWLLVSVALPLTAESQSVRDSTLDALILEVGRVNTDLRIAEERLDAARASRRSASLDLLPTVTAVGSTLRQQQSLALVPGGSLPGARAAQQDLWDFGFDASWEVDIFGRTANRVRAQQALAVSAEHSIADVRVSVVAEVARSYFELRGSQRQLAVALRNAENQRRIVKITEERLAAGRGTAFDTERAKSALFLTLAATPAIETQIALHQQRLAVLLARTPGTLPPAVLGEGPLPELPNTLYVASPEQVLRQRPDVQAAERRVAAEGMLVGSARSDYLPRLTLGARGGYAAQSADALTRTGTSRWTAGPTLTFPLLDLGRVRQRVEIASAGREEARAQYRAAVVRALNESATSQLAYDKAYARLAILEAAVASSTRASELAQQRFEAGLTDFLQVLDAQRTLLEAENQLAAGHTAAAVAFVAVYKAVGGTWPVQ